MPVIRRYAQRAAQWVVDSVTGSGLSQAERKGVSEGGVTAEMSALARQAAAEGCVLLVNDGTLPLKRDEEVAVFGRCQLDWFSMGYGSGGSVHPAYRTNLLDGLDEVKVSYDHVLAQIYKTWCGSEGHRAEKGWWGHWPTSHPEMPLPAELARAAAHRARTAIVVVGRAAGEDVDMPLAPGGFYLTDDEHRMLQVVAAAFERVVVVVDTGNVIDFSWVEEFKGKINAVLLAWHGGMEAGHAVAGVLYGKVCPSGRLACTIARAYEDYPSSATFANKGRVEYVEDIFVGYRHFDTNAPNKVLFPFGHGLSYTRFEEEITHIELCNERLVARVRVANVGACTGRHAVLLWCEPPKKAARPRPTRVLVAFDKTGELAPGTSQELELSCDLKSLSIYDEDAHAFVLETGSYQIDCTQAATSVEIPVRRVLEQCSSICLGSSGLRARISENLPKEMTPTPQENLPFEEVVNGTVALDEFVAQLTDEELEALTCGEGTMNSSFGAPGNAGAFGGVTSSLRKRGIPAVVCADGPSGARLDARCALVPCATALASTWDVALVQELYFRMGEELRGYDVDVLLAPGMNIQRNPRCGRNFEYFSEDPLVSGLMAVAVVRGLRDAGIHACPKHFACNNQETKRNTSDSRVSERALREIYLRGFEICVREAHPALIMTSYNKINGVWAHYHYDLATTVLREEWGFDGVVITDWWMRPARSPEFPELRNNAYRIRAGVDVLMPGSMSHVLVVRDKPSGISRAELQQSARRVLALLLRTK